MHLILSLLLAVLTALNSLAASLFSAPAEEAAAPAMSEAAVLPEWEVPALLADMDTGRSADYGDIEYARCDPEPFYDGISQLYALAAQDDAQAVCQLYDSLYAQCVQASTMGALAYLRYCGDIYDSYWSEEYLYSSGLLTELADSLCTACNYVLQSACAQEFSAYVGDAAAEVFLSYTSSTEEEMALYDRELELINEYYTLLDSIDALTYSYLGEDWTADMLYGYRGEALAVTDYDGYLEVFYGLQQAPVELLAPTYIELVELRQELAACAGYDSYIDYAYETMYGRDYTAAEAQALCDAVKPIAREYYEKYYYSDLWYAYDSVTPVMDTAELLAVLGEYAARVDPSLAEPWEYMTAHGLYDLGQGRGRIDGAFTTELDLYESPFIFQTLYGDCYDLITLSHEFGHYVNSYYSPYPNILTTTDSYDLLEIHSNGLQALLTVWYGEIFDEGAETAEFICLADLLENIIDGCVYDEFQRLVYTYPEPLTAEALNSLYVQVCASYGLYEDRPWDCTWVYVSHNFEAPLYYISYAASAFAALQIWDMSQTDFDAAVDTYLAVLEAGAHDQDYFQVLESCGLRLFTEDGAAAAICAPVLARLAQLEGR